jgi:hypothetical protein
MKKKKHCKLAFLLLKVNKFKIFNMSEIWGRVCMNIGIVWCLPNLDPEHKLGN